MELRSHKTDLLKHTNTSKHKLNITKIGKSQQTIRRYGMVLFFKTKCSDKNILYFFLATSAVQDMKTKKKELILATYVATHSAISSIDHLSEVINRINGVKYPNSLAEADAENFLRLHRTKCSALIKAVIAPSLLQDFILELGDSPFSIMVDESTDVATPIVYLCKILFYAKKRNGHTIFNLFKCNVVFEFFSSNNINLNNLIALMALIAYVVKIILFLPYVEII